MLFAIGLLIVFVALAIKISPKEKEEDKHVHGAGQIGLLAAIALPAMAEIKVDIEGVEGAERQNVEIQLSVMRYLDSKDMDDDTMRRLCNRIEAEVKKALAEKTVNPRDLKRRLARELVRMYHSSESARAAEAEFDRVFVKKDMPDNLPEVALTLAEGSIGIVRLLTEAGFAASNSDARRLITQGGVSVDGQRITDPHAEISLEKSVVLKVGKLRFARVSRV